MPFSHHSHSGQFCPGHAVDSLEEIVQNAISMRMQVFALTEHMPRHDQDRYPEEVEVGSDLESAFKNEAAYFREALRLREKYSSQIELLVGFESEWCGSRSLDLIQRSLHKYMFDFFIGSIHHVGGVPIDYDQAFYNKAREAAGGNDEKLFEAYFDEQLEMLQALRPLIVGHFDLIRLKSDNFNTSLRRLHGVWTRVLRNLDFIASYGGILEVNTAALRKGMDEPYPNSEICQAFLERGGRFCFSDDSHGISQIATNYPRLLPFLQKNKMQGLHYLRHFTNSTSCVDSRFPDTEIRQMDLKEVETLPFFHCPNETDVERMK